MTARTRTATCLVIVMLLAGWNLFRGLGDIHQPIWDENYYITATARFELGRIQFASHPPLGLMLIAAGDRLSGLNRTIDWHPIAAVKSIPGERMPRDFDYRGIRCASALFGTLGAGLFFLLMLALARDRWTALNLSACYIFDGVILTQFRAGHLDAFQIVFILSALLAFVGAVRRRLGWRDLVLGGAIGLATMVRANAVLLLVLPAVLAVARRAPRNLPQSARAALGTLGAAGGGFVIACGLTGACYLAVSRLPPDLTTPAGITDRTVMSERTWLALAKRTTLAPGDMISLGRDYRKYMENDLAGISTGDRNGSSPWGWPVGRRPINYRWDSNGSTTSYLELTPNLVDWLVSLAGLVGCGVLLTTRLKRQPELSAADQYVCAGLLTAWGLLMASDLVLAASRVMYLYHYLPNLILGLAGAALVSKFGSASWRSGALACGLPFLLLWFLLSAPLVFHQPLDRSGCLLRSHVGMVDHCQ